jgi:3-oxoacyl-[acyl-carrier protein] reductase
MRIDLSQRCFIVTGAAQGIGRAIAVSLIEAGAAVAVIDIDAAGMAALPAWDRITRHEADLGDRHAVHDVIAAIAERHGRIDGLVTAAGGVRGQVGRPLEEIAEPDWRAIFAANVDSAMWCAQAVAPHLKKQQAGRIVTISSGAGLRPSLTGIQAYASAKHALVGLTKQLALELGPHGITVNSVAPGFVLSNPSTQKQWEAFGEKRQGEILEQTFMRRLGTAEDIAAPVLFLLSDQAQWITGQTISVDGGRA